MSRIRDFSSAPWRWLKGIGGMPVDTGLIYRTPQPISQTSAADEGPGLFEGFTRTFFRGLDACSTLFELLFDVRETFRRRNYSVDPKEFERDHERALKHLEADQDRQREFERWVYQAGDESEQSHPLLKSGKGTVNDVPDS